MMTGSSVNVEDCRTRTFAADFENINPTNKSDSGLTSNSEAV